MKHSFFTLLLLIYFSIPLIATGGVSAVPFANIPFDVNNIPEPVPPPPAVRDFFELDPFYQQWINIEGFPVLASAKVNPYALKEMAWLIWQIIGHRRDVLQALAENRSRFAVIGYTESLTDIPEYRDYGGGFLLDLIRGQGGGGRPVSSPEERILRYPESGSSYSITIHEFAHAIHRRALPTIDPTFDDRLKSVYDSAITKGLWENTYASSDRKEYWAEGTHAWFHPNGRGSFSQFGNTRQALKAYDPGLAALLTEIYGDGDWRYTSPAARTHLPHLQGFNPQDSPTYQGFPESEELRRQFNDPNSDGGDNWVDLRAYDPSLLPDLSRKRNDSNLSQGFRLSEGIGFLNVTQSRILVYEVDNNDRAHYWTIVNPNGLRVHGGRINDIWLIKDDNGTDLMLFQSQSKLGRAIIGGVPTITPGLSKYAGDNQSGVSGTVLAHPFVVEVRDENGSALKGISITFAVVAGDGTLSITNTTTDENGRAESSFTLGLDLGTNTIEVSAVGIENTVTFNAVSEPAINIPNSNLRAAVETALGKQAGEPIASGEMLALTYLKANNANISDLTGLEHATNLQSLVLEDNNSLSDLSPLAGLTRLEILELWNNSVSDISPLAGLTNLQNLGLVGNNISDVSPLVANTGLETGDAVWLRGNPLSYQSLYTYIPALQSRGVRVRFDSRKVQKLLKISGDNQQGKVGTVLTEPFIVEVRDRTGIVFAEVPVTFAVTGGSGTLSVTSTTTDANGRAQSTLTLGTDIGTTTVAVSAAGTEAQVIFNAIANPLTTEYLLSISAGMNLIHVPLDVTAVDGVEHPIESISDLYDALGGANVVNFLITYAPQTQDWLTYFGTSETGTPADRALTDDMAIIAGLIAPVSIDLTGTPLGTNGSSTISLSPGLNVVGLPLNNLDLTRVSDLLELDGIRGNVPVIILTDGGDFQSVGRAGDPSDIPITGGQGFILTVQQAATVRISGEAWSNTLDRAAAPLVTRKGMVGDTTPVLALRGVVVDERTGLTQTALRVTVKNLSADRSAAAIAAPDEAGYRLTVVDIKTGRAAKVGDVLEISAQSPDPFIGVESLRYTVTAEDVKNSLIQMPELVAYEIPTETQLLANYPNPFTPETWIPYRLAEDAFVTLTVYDTVGRIVRTLEVGYQIASAYESRPKAVHWNGRNNLGEQVASGVYFYTLIVGDFSATRKMLIRK